MNLWQLIELRLREKNEAVIIYQPLAKSAVAEQLEQSKAFNQVFDAYLSGDFIAAKQQLDLCIAKWGEQPIFQLYQQRLLKLIANPPTDCWHGIYTHKSK